MDTIRIKLKQGRFLIKNPAFFNEVKSSQFYDSPNHKVEKTNNAFRKGLASRGLYAPKFGLKDISFGVPDNSLVLEFSVAKLLYGTNLKEVTEADLPAVIQKLKEFLKSIGISIFESELLNATVTLIAYAKNIPVGHLGKVSEILRVIAPFDYRPRSDFTVVLYRQGVATSELKYFNPSSHLTLYDKLTEVLHNPVTKEEIAICDYLKKGTNPELFKSWVQELRHYH
jgi:hypothetical protein